VLPLLPLLPHAAVPSSTEMPSSVRPVLRTAAGVGGRACRFARCVQAVAPYAVPVLRISVARIGTVLG
jgi:hypothetical protein